MWLCKCAPNNGRQLPHIAGYSSIPMELFHLREANYRKKPITKITYVLTHTRIVLTHIPELGSF